jgi:hypothetical protein
MRLSVVLGTQYASVLCNSTGLCGMHCKHIRRRRSKKYDAANFIKIKIKYKKESNICCRTHFLRFTFHENKYVANLSQICLLVQDVRFLWDINSPVPDVTRHAYTRSYFGLALLLLQHILHLLFIITI